MPHSFKNETSEPAKMLISVAPAGLEEMFFEVGVPVAQGATTAAPPTKDELEKLLAVTPKYGIEIKLLGIEPSGDDHLSGFGLVRVPPARAFVSSSFDRSFPNVRHLIVCKWAEMSEILRRPQLSDPPTAT